MQRNNNSNVLVFVMLLAFIVGAGIFSWVLSIQPTNKKDPDSTPTSPVSASPSGIPPKNFRLVQGVPTGLFNYGGSTTWAPIRGDETKPSVDQAIQAVWPEFKLRYVDHPTKAPGSGTGIEMLLNNQLAFSQSSRPLKSQEYDNARQRNFTLKEIAVAIDGIAVAVHPSLNIPGITIDELKRIYIGEIVNWSEVGGPNLPIKPYSRSQQAGGTVEFFVENILGKNGSFGFNVEIVANTTQGLRNVTQNQGGIYYASAPEVVGQCTIKPLPLGKTPDKFVPPYEEPFIPLSQCPARRNQVNADGFRKGDYPITRRLFVIVKQNGQADEPAGETYAWLLLTDQGQDLIQNAGFVPIR